MKRSISLLLAAVMMLALLASCSQSAPAPVSETTPSQAAPDTPSEPSKPEYSEITVEVFDRGTDGGKTDPTNNFYTDWIKKKLLEDENIGVTFQAVSRWEEQEQLNNLMAAGNAPDVCLTYSTDLITTYRELGGLVDLAPYIETHLPDLDAFLGEDAAVPGKRLIYRQITESGQVFSIPARRINTAAVNTFIRKDWLDKLNMPIPTTIDEFYNTLKAFKEQDPGGVGKSKVIPFIIGSRDVRWRARTLLDSFIDPNLSDKDRWINTVVDREFLLPGYKEGLRYLNKLYNEGLTDTEFALYTDDTNSDNLIKSGVVGSFIHNWDQPYRDTPGLLKDLKANVPDAEIISIDCFKNAAGKYYKNAYEPAGVNFFIPASSKNVEGALRYINWLSKVENRYFLQIGEEGVTHVMVDGAPKMISAEGEKIMNSSQNIDYTIMINGLDTGDEATNLKAMANSYNVDPQLIMTAYENAMRDAKPLMVVPGLTLTAAAPVSQTLVDKGWTLLAECVTCKPADFDATWDRNIADWLASGAQAVVDERAQKFYQP